MEEEDDDTILNVWYLFELPFTKLNFYLCYRASDSAGIYRIKKSGKNGDEYKGVFTDLGHIDSDEDACTLYIYEDGFMRIRDAGIVSSFKIPVEMTKCYILDTERRYGDAE